MGPVIERLRGYRYVLVLAIALVAVIFAIVAPDTPVAHALAETLASATLFTAVVTSRETQLTRTRLAAIVAATIVAVAVATGLDAIPQWIGAAAALVALVLSLVVLPRGIVRLLRARGVSLAAIAGALAIYVLLGLVYGLAFGVAARLTSGSWFAQGGGTGTLSQHVYASFETLTTTGYGDLTPATRVGRALTVVEMLTGQIYLVTVIALLIGNVRRQTDATAAEANLPGG